MTSPGWVEQWLSTPRHATYLRQAGGDPQRALALYEWNTQLNAAFLHDFCHLEVGLRNVFDRALQAAVVPNDTHWTNEHTVTAVLLRQSGNADHRTANDIREARRRASGKTANSVPDRVVGGKVIAELSFGFWPYLLTNARRNTLWVPYLQSAFPPRTDRDQLHMGLVDLARARNRVAHHEPLRRNQIVPLQRKISRYANYVSLELRDYIAHASTIDQLRASRP
ncbi:CAAX protease [Gordonia sp. (in: high G+C Gram-positive bacteria)]|uniref:CAAX protease n=1 Tax=Gordonia sp. (in: high G+C Gram-positive bacteria) TaxID=84139 RepID=UPI00261CE28E|nr:CAAX protease [Gordonia sp. (in: high G+C Gram-positive bacteria)]